MSRRRLLVAASAAVVALVTLGLAASAGGTVAVTVHASGSCVITQSKSLEGKVRTDIKFVNKTSGVVKVYWLDYNGKRVLYDTIPAGASVVQPTWKTHPWVAVDNSGRCVGYVIAPKAEYDIVGPASGGGGSAPAKKETFTAVICTIAVNGIDSRCTAQVADATPQRSNPPTGTATFSAKKGLVGKSCSLAGTPGSPGISSCTVSYTPPSDLVQGEPPPVSAEYSGDASFEASSGASGYYPVSVTVVQGTTASGDITIDQLNENPYSVIATDAFTSAARTTSGMGASVATGTLVAQATFRLKAMASSRVKIKLTAAGRKLLAGHKSLKTTLTVTTVAKGKPTKISVKHVLLRG